jgi:hypothetical protein
MRQRRLMLKAAIKARDAHIARLEGQLADTLDLLIDIQFGRSDAPTTHP